MIISSFDQFKKTVLTVIAALLVCVQLSAAEKPEGLQTDSEHYWHQPAGPNFNWQVAGEPPIKWSATRGENIEWRTPMPEAGMSSVTVWGDRCFVTTHVPIESLEEKNGVTDIIGYCLNTTNGEILWQVTLPGTSFISLAGGFTDGSVFAPITDGKHVWFFNRCGSMGCYDFDGKKVWLREWTPRFKHNNRQCEPILIGNTILYVEVANKAAGATMQKWKAPGKKAGPIKIPADVDEKEVWTYIHGIDKQTGKVLWRENVGTSIHTTPTVARLADGTIAISHARGGPHGTIEKPYGHSLTSLAPGHEGQTLWSTDFDQYDPSFACHLNERFAFGFHLGHHVVMDVKTGKELRRDPLYEQAQLWKYETSQSTWTRENTKGIKAGKGHPNTNQANIAIVDWHWFLAHNFHYIGRVHIETGKVEYLEVPAMLIASEKDRKQDRLLWGKQKNVNHPVNASGFAVGDKGHNGTGWGHISAASPTLVGKYLFCPVVTGTVYVIDTTVDELSPDSLIAVNDLGPGGKTWSLSSLSFANGRIYAHTMREIICIEAK